MDFAGKECPVHGVKLNAVKEKTMLRHAYLLALIPLLVYVATADGGFRERQQRQQPQFPEMEQVAQQVIQKYQRASCQELAAQKQQPPSAQEAQKTQEAMEILRSNPQMRTAFLDRVAGPIANKLFECGMIP
jgi:hypothetical protein